MSEASDFLLLQPGGRQRDEAWGGADLMEFFHLMRLYSFSQSQLQPVNYLKGVPGDTTLRRGPNTDVEPLAEVFPLAQQPAWQPLPAEQLNAALSLQPGVSALSEAEKGVPVAPGAYQAEDASGGAAVKREKKSGKKRKLGAPD